MDKVEKKLYSEVLKEEPPILKDKKVEKSEIVNVLDLARRRIGISPINVDDLNRIANLKKVRGEECLRYAVEEFIYEELKMDENEVNELGKFRVYRKDDDQNDRIYLNFDNETSCEYIMKKSIICRNKNIRVFPYIPPQIFGRFIDFRYGPTMWHAY